MRKVKLLVLCAVTLLITGCSVNYNVEIYNETVKVNGTLLESDSGKWNENIFGVTYKEMIDLKTTGDEDNPVLEGLFKIDNEDGLGVGLKSKYSLLEQYENSPGIKSCYEYFRVIEEDDTIVLSTSVNNTCFDTYANLDVITVNLKTNHKVEYSNADVVDGYHYTWNIYREEKDDSPILITLKKDDYVFNYENEFVKKILTIAIIVGIILGGSGLIYLFFKTKSNNANQI